MSYAAMNGGRTLRAIFLVGLASLISLAAAASHAGATRVPANSLPAEFYGITPATRLSEEELASMAAARVGTLRVPFFWEDIQPLASPHFDWRKTDRIMGGAARNGMQVLPFLMGTPRWLEDRNRPESPSLDSRWRERWSALLGALVDRYGPGGTYWAGFEALNPGIASRPIGAWQIWNEPNDPGYWRPLRTAPERYAQLLALSGRVLAEHDPDATLVAAGLFGTPPDGMRMQRFLRRLYGVDGARGTFDVLALHPYASDVAGVLEQLADARALMSSNGDGRKPLWITELGWPTLHEVGTASGGFVTSERGQKRLLTRSFSEILERREAWRVERLGWYTWRDNDLFESCNLCRYSGLFREDLTPKPAWSAFVSFTGGSPEVPPQPPGPLGAP